MSKLVFKFDNIEYFYTKDQLDVFSDFSKYTMCYHNDGDSCGNLDSAISKYCNLKYINSINTDKNNNNLWNWDICTEWFKFNFKAIYLENDQQNNKELENNDPKEIKFVFDLISTEKNGDKLIMEYISGCYNKEFNEFIKFLFDDYSFYVDTNNKNDENIEYIKNIANKIDKKVRKMIMSFSYFELLNKVNTDLNNFNSKMDQFLETDDLKLLNDEKWVVEFNTFVQMQNTTSKLYTMVQNCYQMLGLDQLNLSIQAKNKHISKITDIYKVKNDYKNSIKSIAAFVVGSLFSIVGILQFVSWVHDKYYEATENRILWTIAYSGINTLWILITVSIFFGVAAKFFIEKRLKKTRLKILSSINNYDESNQNYDVLVRNWETFKDRLENYKKGWIKKSDTKME
ncbi:hypothetical protein ACJA23_02535 [Mycoplasma corogypsi]|uniref:hypothetical protein n=1 Tax=Mycoplasma corogypsi TaxID=2106 RepID=UPI00387305D4